MAISKREGQRPDEAGFDEYLIWNMIHLSPSSENGSRYDDPHLHHPGGSTVYPGDYGPNVVNRRILDFITENKDVPFFVYYPMLALTTIQVILIKICLAAW